MYAIMLCDWVTVRGATATSPVVQGEDQWLDLGPYTDCTLWVDIREVTGTVSLALETSPTKDDAYFKSMVTAAGLTTLVANPAPTAYAVLLSTATVPLARWLRWKLASATATWDVTMRIWASVNAPGG